MLGLTRVIATAAALLAYLATFSAAAASNDSLHPSLLAYDPSSSSLYPDSTGRCPPCPEPSCFNCLLPKFNCAQFGDCNEYDGTCSCPIGFGGQDCLAPLCGSPADGSKRFPRKGDECDCSEGWSGLNCNVCQTDDACADFQLGGERLGENGTCYKGGSTVAQSFQQCDVTNRKIVELLPGRPPRVTFSCDREDRECNFQFWIGQNESFYCGLYDCDETLERTAQSNTTRHECKKVECSCVPERMLCGEAGSIDISDFLKEDIKGPGTMTCRSGKDGERNCRFEEPGMNGLISSVFGDEAIFLSCESGECVHYSQVPGYQEPLPPPTSRFWVFFSSASALLVVIIAALIFYLLGRHDPHDELGTVRLPEEEAAKLMADHVPATLHFDSLAYSLGDKRILSDISGSVRPGEVMAIVGASGAGKTTFLDILSGRNKRGIVEGHVLVNGRRMNRQEYQSVVGFVDQEDCLMPTLTVYETVLYSALLRLPRSMSIEAKKYRTLETMQELGILGIKDSRIGDSGRRSISGGEKRRVSIACELVTSPSVVFLDEPTSGLDAASALNVVESLVTLAKEYRRTVVFTIHQPRSNIVALFDRLVVLAAGRLVYAGALDGCVEHFAAIGHPCPTGFNLGDHLIDLTADAVSEPPSRSDEPAPAIVATRTPYRDEEEGPSAEAATELRTRPNSLVDSAPSSLRDKRSRLGQNLRAAFSSRNGNGASPREMPAKLAALVEAFDASEIHKSTRSEIQAFTVGAQTPSEGNVNSNSTATNELPDALDPDRSLRGYAKATLWTQFTILSGRAFKNLYRNPMLMAAHYAMSVLLALFCGVLYHDITNDIAGFQNRLGLFFFILSLFGFSTLTSLGIFANERALFVRERANGYYNPVTYMSAKLLCDILPLRIIPPLLLGGIVYFMVGLVPQVAQFWMFILTLVLFSLAASSVVFLISILVKDTGVANLVGSLTMLFSLLFAGLLINRERMPWYLRWLTHLSFFHAAYEALIVNELRHLTLTERRYGIDITVPSATILSSFGFDAQAFWFPDIATLGIIFGATTVLSGVALTLFVKEKR